ncbi:unnamed protein product, partial [Owenia fusiformis]
YNTMWNTIIIKLALLIAVVGLIEAGKNRSKIRRRTSKTIGRRKLNKVVPAASNNARYCVDELDEDKKTYYEDLGCTITIEDSNTPDEEEICFKLSCPTGCPVEGRIRKGKVQYEIGEEWIEGKRKSCSCQKGGWMYFDVPEPISDTDGEEVKPPPFELPVTECLPMGCEHEGKFFASGKTRSHPRGICTCMKGNDPHIMDGKTLYYFKCPLRTRSSGGFV